MLGLENGVIVRVFYEYSTYAAGSSGTSGALTNNETRSVILGGDVEFEENVTLNTSIESTGTSHPGFILNRRTTTERNGWDETGFQGTGRKQMMILTHVDKDGNTDGYWLSSPPAPKSIVRSPAGFFKIAGTITGGANLNITRRKRAYRMGA